MPEAGWHIRAMDILYVETLQTIGESDIGNGMSLRMSGELDGFY